MMEDVELRTSNFRLQMAFGEFADGANLPAA
jgi:hypothetical protein